MKLLIDRWLVPFHAIVVETLGAPAEALDATTLLGPARDPKHGVLASGVGFRLAEALKQPPLAIAKRVAEACTRRAAELPGLLQAREAPPGYVNLVAAPAFYAGLVEQILRAGRDFGRSEAGRGQRVNLEFCSANPTGPLHVAHGRQAAVGDCLANVLAFAGHEVVREYYWNDTGNQVKNLLASVCARGRQLLAGQPTDGTIGFEGGYSGAYITELAQRLIAEQGPGFVAEPPGGCEAPSPLRETVVARMKALILDDLAAFGVRYDVQTSQEHLEETGKVSELIEEFKREGLIEEKEGALWFRAEEFGDTQNWVLVKSDGAYTYRAPDYAYHRDKFERGFDRVINLWGPDHHAYVGSVRAGLRAMYAGTKGSVLKSIHSGSWWSEDRFRVLLVQFCKMMRGKEEVKMSKRGGTFVTLREVIDEVGPDATRFFFVLRKIDSHLAFDLELAKAQKSENPVYYAQYAHARLAAVLRKASEQHGPDAGEAVPPGEEEGQLLQAAGRFPDAVERAAEELEPYVVTEYILKLAAALQSWYQLGDKDPQFRMLHPDALTRRMRLGVARAVQVVLRNGLTLLGVGAPERMEAPAT